MGVTFRCPPTLSFSVWPHLLISYYRKISKVIDKLLSSVDLRCSELSDNLYIVILASDGLYCQSTSVRVCVRACVRSFVRVLRVGPHSYLTHVTHVLTLFAYIFL